MHAEHLYEKEKAYPLLLCISVSVYGNPPDVEYTY